MPTIVEVLRQAKTILTTSAVQVEQTVAHELLTTLGGRAEIKRSSGFNAPAGSISVAVVQERAKWGSIHPALDSPKEWMMVRAKNGGGIELLASRSHLLYYLYTILAENWKGLDIGEFAKGKIAYPTFKNLRPVYDLFLTQHARTVRNFNREEHVRNLARMGFSHVEANGLAFAVPFERGPQGELLHRFYTYCPSLDEFVASKLNKGIYDDDYLQANLNFLKTNAELGQKNGLTPGLVCFEPRSVPDNLLQKYPMLRGARVDHPIRSWHPRYNLTAAASGRCSSITARSASARSEDQLRYEGMSATG